MHIIKLNRGGLAIQICEAIRGERNEFLLLNTMNPQAIESIVYESSRGNVWVIVHISLILLNLKKIDA